MWEWNEALVYDGYAYRSRGLRGGSFYVGDVYDLQSSYRYYLDPSYEGDCFGFRVSQVPEPSSIITLLGGLAGLLGMRRRRA